MNLQPTTHKLQASRGFTLTEVIVVVAIAGILSSVLLANTRGPSRKFDVRRATQQIIADLRKTQALAISSQTATCGASTITPYHGLRMQTNLGNTATYSIFVDCDKDNTYNGAGDDFILETVTLDNVFVNSTSPSSGGSTFLEVVYIPPIPSVAISGSAFVFPAVGTFQIEICNLRETNLCIQVEGNSRGNVEIQ